MAPQQVMEIDLNAPVMDGEVNPQELILFILSLVVIFWS